MSIFAVEEAFAVHSTDKGEIYHKKNLGQWGAKTFLGKFLKFFWVSSLRRVGVRADLRRPRLPMVQRPAKNARWARLAAVPCRTKPLCPAKKAHSQPKTFLGSRAQLAEVLKNTKLSKYTKKLLKIFRFFVFSVAKNGELRSRSEEGVRFVVLVCTVPGAAPRRLTWKNFRSPASWLPIVEVFSSLI